MDTSAAGTGTVSLDYGIGVLTGGTWTDSMTYSIPYTALTNNTPYSVDISGFKDAGGNTMDADNTRSFRTVKATPDITNFFYFPRTAAYNGLPNGTIASSVDEVGTITTYYDSSVTPPVNAGSYVVSVSVTEGADYVAAYGIVLGTFTIDPATITVAPDSGQGKTYGEPDPALAYSVLIGQLYGTDVFTGGLTRSLGGDAGTYSIAQGTLAVDDGNGGANYILSFTSGGTFDIDPLDITVTPTSGQSKVQGEPDPVFAFSVSPALVTGDFFTGALNRDPGDAVGTYLIKSGSLAVNDGNGGANYNLSFTSGVTFEVVSAGAKVKDYYITATSDNMTSISPKGTVAVSKGSNLTFGFSASQGYHVSAVAVDGVNLTKEQVALGQYTFRNVSANHTIEVKSAAGTGRTVTVTIDTVGGEGSIEYRTDGGQFRPYTPGTVFPDPSNVTFRAVPADGYRFVKWETSGTVFNTPEVTLSNAEDMQYLVLFLEKGTDQDDGFPWLTVALVGAAIIFFALAAAVIFWKKPGA
jgi:hypothetical protein